MCPAVRSVRPKSTTVSKGIVIGECARGSTAELLEWFKATRTAKHTVRKPMIYTDGTHLVGTSLKELHEFAQSIGLKKEWFQDHRHPHYDLLSKRILNKALQKGAVLGTKRDMVRLHQINSKEVSHA